MDTCVPIKNLKIENHPDRLVRASVVQSSGQTINKDMSISMPKGVAVEVGVDALGFAILLGTLGLNVLSTLFGAINFSKIGGTAKRNIETRIKQHDIEQNKQIEAVLNRIIGVSNASRVAVAVFTNGNDAYVFSFKYFSILWEVCNLGIADTRSKYQRVPLINIRDELDKCFQNDGKFVTYRITDDQPDRCKNYLIANNIHTVLSRLIGNKKDGYSGIINIQFASEQVLSESTMIRIEELFLILESMLEKKNRVSRPRFLFF